MTTAKGYTEMKDSGIEWVGMIPAHWHIKVLFQLVSQVKNKNKDLSETNLLSLSYGKIKRKNIDDTEGLLPASFDSYNIIENNDIVLRLTDLQNDHTSLRVGRATERGIITSAYITIRPTNSRMSEYLYYLLHSFDIKKGFYGMGSGVRQGLNYDEVKMLKLPLPPLNEESAIAAYLDTQCAKIDEIIAQAKASMEDYKQWKASIIYEAVTKGLNPNVEMKDSGIEWVGNVPAHWRVTKIKNFVSLRSGITLGKQYPPDAQLVSRPYLRVANVKAEHVDLQDVATIMVTIEEAEKYALKPGELLMTEGGDRDKLGRGTIWHGEIPGCLHQNHVFAVQVDEKYMLTKFLDYLTASPVGREYFDLTAKKTTNLASTNATTILQFSVPIPPLTEQEKIITILDRNTATINEVIAEKETLVSDLESYKKSLIYEVVTGKRYIR